MPTPKAGPKVGGSYIREGNKLKPNGPTLSKYETPAQAPTTEIVKPQPKTAEAKKRKA